MTFAPPSRGTREDPSRGTREDECEDVVVEWDDDGVRANVGEAVANPCSERAAMQAADLLGEYWSPPLGMPPRSDPVGVVSPPFVPDDASVSQSSLEQGETSAARKSHTHTLTQLLQVAG